jgi:thioredoxin:protein disulfide reductase
MWKVFLAALFSCFLSLAHADGEIKPLPVGQAFILSGHTTANSQLVLKWVIAPGYYLYRNKISITPIADNQVPLGSFELPAGVPRNDILHGDFQAYINTVEVTVPLTAASGRLALKIGYQGCSSQGFCYTPINKSLIIDLAKVTPAQELIVNSINTPPAPVAVSISDQRYVTQLLNGHHYFLMMVSFLFLGVLLAFTPCVLPMVPILSSIIVGQGRLLNSRKAFFLSLAYVLGMALAYACAGMLVAILGSNIQLYMEKPWVICVFSALFIVLALSLFGLFEIRLPHALQQRLSSRSTKHQSGTYAGVFLMGVFSTLIVSPCVSAPLVGVLAYIAKSGDVLLGGLALMALGLGMGLPLLLVGASAGKLLPKAGTWMEAVRHFFGLMMLGVAIWMLSRILPGPAILFLWALLAIVAAGFVRQLKRSKKIWQKLHQGLGLVLLCYGFILMVGAIIGMSDPLYLLGKPQYSITSNTKSSFTVLKSMSQLNDQLALAKSRHLPVLLDFYADWCVSCVIMDRSVFIKPEIKTALGKFILLRADITQNNDFDQALLQRFNIVAPPTIVMFNSNGEIQLNNAIVGEVDSKQFLSDLDKVTDDKKNKICLSKTSSC